MKSNFFSRIHAAVFLVTVAFFIGCKTTPKVDWNSRIGNYTYDQAVAELGPPDKSAKLSDGITVAEWVTGRSASPSFGIGVGSYGSHTGVGVGQTIGGGSYAQILRLTFGADGKLLSSAKQNR